MRKPTLQRIGKTFIVNLALLKCTIFLNIIDFALLPKCISCIIRVRRQEIHILLKSGAPNGQIKQKYL